MTNDFSLMSTRHLGIHYFTGWEQTDSCQRDGRIEGWVENVKGLGKKRKTKHLIDTDNGMIITRRKNAWWEGGRRG